MKRIMLAVISVFCGVFAALGANAGLDAWTGAMHGSRPRLPARETRSPRTLSTSEEVLVKNGGTAFDAAKAVAARVFDDSEMSAITWKNAFSSEEERVDVGTLVTSEGLQSSFAVYGQLGNFAPYYWTVSGLAGGQDIPAMLKDVGLARDGSAVYMADGLLSADDVQVLERGVSVPVPFERFYFAFMDDAPHANWEHPCRYVFVSEDATSFAALYKTRPPKLLSKATSETLCLSPLAKAKEEKAGKSLQQVKNEVYAYANRLESNGITYSTGDKSKSYFVLISGGDCPEGNGIRFWSDTAMMYSTLTKKYGVSKNRIFVYISDGTSTGKDANLGDWSSPELVDSPLDLDGDGSSDVDGAASSSVISSAFSSLKSNLTADDQLWVFVTSHGGSDGTAGPSNYDSLASLFSSDGWDYFTDDQLANWTSGIKCPVVFAIETCYSGGFVDDILKTSNRAIATACNNNELSYGSTGGYVEDYWDDVGRTLAYNKFAVPFIAAIRGYEPAPYNSYGYPWEDDSSVKADANSDGLVSFGEESRYALANDEARCTSSSHPDWCSYYYDSYGDYQNRYEHPQYGESTSGLGDSIFVLKQTQAPVAMTLPNALDNTLLTFTTGGDAPWAGQRDLSHDGADAAQSGAIIDSQTSWLQTTVSGAGTISFWWYVSCEGSKTQTNWDYLAVFVDDVEKARICGTDNSWEQKSFTVSSGSHTIKWLYNKDYSTKSGEDAGFVDQVVWMPTATSCTVTFDPNGGSVQPQERMVDYGLAIGELPTPLRAGHTFLGWFTAAEGGVQVFESTLVAGDVTYYAHWSLNAYTVTFDPAGGTSVQSITQSYATPITPPEDPTRIGYTFVCWSPAVPSVMPDTNTTCTAQWQVNQYTVTFDANGGTGGSRVTQDYGTAIAAPPVTREGYVFAGWRPEPLGTVPASNVTYTAQWIHDEVSSEFAKSIQIVFVGYAGEGSLTDFPALVRLSPAIQGFSYSDFRKSDGGDLRFYDDAGNMLAHEIDTWNMNGESTVWVKVPLLAATTAITAKYGCTAPAEVVDPKSVWSNGYVGVWHLGGATSMQVDSTASGKTMEGDSAAATNMAYGVDGVVGKAVEQATPNGVNNYRGGFQVSDSSGLYNGTKTLTFEMWANQREIVNDKYIVRNTIGSSMAYSARWTWPLSGGDATKEQLNYSVALKNLATGTGKIYSNVKYSVPTNEVLGAWRHYALVIDNETLHSVGAYHDGVLKNSQGIIDEDQTIDVGSAILAVGNSAASAVRQAFPGAIDELRVSRVARSAAWMKATHDTVMNAGFATYSPVASATASGYAAWIAGKGIPGTDAAVDNVTNGIANAVRYAFDIPPAVSEVGTPVIQVVTDANGNPCVQSRDLATGRDDVTLTVLATEDLSNWQNLMLVPMEKSATDGLWKPAASKNSGYTYPSKMFFKYRINIQQ